RLEFSKSQIEEMDGRTFFVYAIQNGWISKGSVQNLDRLHSVEFTDGRMARATVPAAPKMPLFYFMKEDGAWKVALWKTFPLIESALVGAIKQQGLTEEEFIVQSFGAVSENEINSEIYQQLLASPRE
ncbi:MAG TPA: hypothetical protein VGE52_19150, partial [Pirellulales bacterium]